MKMWCSIHSYFRIILLFLAYNLQDPNIHYVYFVNLKEVVRLHKNKEWKSSRLFAMDICNKCTILSLIRCYNLYKSLQEKLLNIYG